MEADVSIVLRVARRGDVVAFVAWWQDAWMFCTVRIRPRVFQDIFKFAFCSPPNGAYGFLYDQE
jgi:hypothetical protein